jgi:tyrosyl-tRNA synthetase
VNPRDAKEVLGKDVVRQYWGAEAAEAAAEAFRRRAKGEDPEEIPGAPLSRAKLDERGRIAPASLVKELGLEPSASAARRLVEQGGLNIGPDRTVVRDIQTPIEAADGLIVRAGKRRIVRVRLVD